MKRAFVFPGQGSQYVGMGKDLVEAFPSAAALYRRADEVLGAPISRLSFEGPLEELTATKNAQPAILLHSVAVLGVLREEAGLAPAIVAGHSLGEYSALVAAGALDPLDALRIVRRRGELMFEAGLKQAGTMAAIIGMEEDAVGAVCRDAADGGTVVIANINSPGQIVISGDVASVGRAVALATERGAKKAMPLTVSGAFHSPLVAPAAEALVRFLGEFAFRDAAVPVVCNVDARAITAKEDIVDALSRQLTSPVRWSASMAALMASFDGPAIEAGPGKVLAGLMKRIDGSRPVATAGTAEEVARLVAAKSEIA